MASIRARVLAVGGVMLAVTASQGAAQVTYPNVRVGGRLQTQAYYFGNEEDTAATGSTNNFMIRRARIQASGQISETVSFIIMPSFEEGSTRLRLRDAWIDIGFQRGEPKTRFTLRMGQEKRPFNRYELLTSNNLPSLERGAGRGLIRAASNDIFTASGFLSHDVGASLIINSRLNEGQALTFQAGVYNGEGESRNDVNDKKSFGIRATAGVTSKLNLGASFFSHDGVNGPDSSYTNSAIGVDAQWGRPGDEGLFLVGDFMTGENRTDNDIKMQGFQVVGAYHIRMKSPTAFLYAIEPAARFDLADPDKDTDDDGATLISAGINVYFSSRAQFRAMFESQSFQASGSSSITGIRSGFNVNF